MPANQWGFYGRSEEQREIERILQTGRWFFCAISGRRRIGKTTLIQRALMKAGKQKTFYFQVPDSDERGVVQTFRDALVDIGLQEVDTSRNLKTFNAMARLIAEMCRDGWIIIIDEFQYFHRKSLSPFASHLQAQVDSLRESSRGGLFVLGSIHTEMTAILEDQASPLFNRITHRIELKHWDFETLFEMFNEHGVQDPHRRLFLWSLFEGVPKFHRDCFEQGVFSLPADDRQETLHRLFFSGSSPLRDEAINWFLRELRGRYDSVLKLLARNGHCSYGELTRQYADAGSGGDKQLSAYLQTLIEHYGMVEKLLPVFATNRTRKARYAITDNFLAAWLNALARNVQIARVRPAEEATRRASEALKDHEGPTFEKMIRLLMEETSRKNRGDFPLSDIVRGYWNKPDGSDVEIDIVAFDEEARRVRFGSCKRTANRHDSASLHGFEEHIDRFLRTREGKRLTGWEVEKALFSPAFSAEKKACLESQGYIARDLNDFAAELGQA